MTKLLSRWGGWLILVLYAFILITGLGPGCASQVVLLGDRIWDGYAAQLRTPAKRPACDLQAAQAKAAACTQEADAGGGDDDIFGDSEQKAGCDSLKALVDRCKQRHTLYQARLARETTTLGWYRAVDSAVVAFVRFTCLEHLLALLLLLGGLRATLRDEHLALAPYRNARARRVGNGVLLTVAASFSASLIFAATRADMTGRDRGILALSAAAFIAISGAALWRILRPVPVDGGTQSAGQGEGAHTFRERLAVAASIPLIAWLGLVVVVYFFAFEGNLAGPAVYLQKFMQVASIYLGVALLVMAGLVFARARITERAAAVVAPLQLPYGYLVILIVLGAAYPTAYSGASGIFVLAAGAAVFQMLRLSGASPRFALAATTMAGSGVFLRPSLVVVLIATLNSNVTTGLLYDAGFRVFLLTGLLLAIMLVLVKRRAFAGRPDVTLTSLKASLQLARPFGIYLLVTVAWWLVARYLLGSPVNEFSMPFLLPLLMLGWLVASAFMEAPQVAGVNGAEVGDATKDDVPGSPRFSELGGMALTSIDQCGGLLLLMAMSVGVGGVIERWMMSSQLTLASGPVVTMLVLIVILIAIGMVMDPMGAVVLVSVSLAGLAAKQGIGPIHFWLVVLVAFELGYVTPPVAINQLLARKAIGSRLAGELAASTGACRSSFEHVEHILLPILLMLALLLVVAFAPFFGLGWLIGM